MRPIWSVLYRLQVALKAAFEVARLVFVDDVFLSQPINHGSHYWQLSLQFLSIRGGTVLPKGIPHRFVVVAVAEALGLVAADALEG